MNTSLPALTTAQWRERMLNLEAVKRYGLESECGAFFDTAVAGGTAPDDAVWYALQEWDVFDDEAHTLLTNNRYEEPQT